MSGLEVAGLVLGLLPIAVKTLQTFKKALSLYKNAVRFIHTLETDLTNEYFILAYTCELLLHDIAPTSKIGMMLENPFGPEWKEEHFDRTLRIRLGQSYSSVEGGIEQLKKLVEELTRKLGLGSDLKVRGGKLSTLQHHKCLDRWDQRRHSRLKNISEPYPYIARYPVA